MVYLSLNAATICRQLLRYLRVSLSLSTGALKFSGKSQGLAHEHP